MLEIKNISKTFHAGTPNEVRALRQVNLVLEKGSFVIIIGSNGSGKSTTLNAVAGTFFVDSGSILLAGKDITSKHEYQRAKWIGRVFQNPFSGTAPNMSIEENLALATRRGFPRGLGWALSKSMRQQLMDRVRKLNMGLENRLANPIGTLSGGQRQALTLLMATWVKPEMLLLDEHTAALDPKSADQVIQLSKEIIEQDHLTTLMVTHSMQQAVNLGDRLIMMHKGKVIHDLSGPEKKRLKVDDLLSRFQEIRRKDLMDESTADLLKRRYI
jgi:putative ABC transport system ATP-binding protein